MPRQARIALTLGLAAALIAAAGCGGSSSTGADRPAASPAGSTTPVTAGSASSGSAPAGDRFAALPPCNVFPDSLSGTFQGNLIQMTPTAKPGDTWTAAAACLGMLAGPQRQPGTAAHGVRDRSGFGHHGLTHRPGERDGATVPVPSWRRACRCPRSWSRP
jgi:hypothetical protein